jgi:hypothetical protein
VRMIVPTIIYLRLHPQRQQLEANFHTEAEALCGRLIYYRARVT